MFSQDDLKRIMPAATQANIAKFHQPLVDACHEFEIEDVLRMAAFLANVAVESGSLRYVREIASGEAYEGRADLGNTEPGDGRRYRGRGLIQITGRANTAECGDALGLPLVEQPELLEEPENAARSAGWFWASRGLNALADRGAFKAIVKKINGGYNHFPERVAHYNRALEVLA